MQPFSDDTSPEAHRVYITLLRRKSVADRLRMVQRLNDAADTMALARLTRDYPDDTPRQRRLRLQALKYGDALMKQVFDWDVRAIPDLDYHLVEAGDDGGIGGGILKPKAGPWPAKLALYIDVDDLDAYGEKVVAAGGKILVDKKDVPGVGQLSLFEDPDGRVLGMWKQIAPTGD